MEPDVLTGDAANSSTETGLGSKRDLMSAYGWTDDERKEFLLSCGVTPVGPKEPHPERCPVCSDPVGISWEFHMIVDHPETRPKIEGVTDKPKKKRKKR